MAIASLGLDGRPAVAQGPARALQLVKQNVAYLEATLAPGPPNSSAGG
jgi:hypothetical protein